MDGWMDGWCSVLPGHEGLKTAGELIEPIPHCDSGHSPPPGVTPGEFSPVPPQAFPPSLQRTFIKKRHIAMQLAHIGDSHCAFKAPI